MRFEFCYTGYMDEFANKESYVVVLEHGSELHKALGEHARDHELASAWVEGIGAAERTTLGIYHLGEKQYTWKEFEAPLEILSLKGNLSWVDGEPFWHIHGVFSDENFTSFGGHVKELVVGATCELLITPLEVPTTRVFDDETGLKLLSYKPIA